MHPTDGPDPHRETRLDPIPPGNPNAQGPSPEPIGDTVIRSNPAWGDSDSQADFSLAEGINEPILDESATGSGAPKQPNPVLARLGDYDLLSPLGKGGMGVVYRARQRSLNRLVAVKVVRAGTLASAEQVRRFRNEAEVAAGLDHPRIVPVYEVGEEGEHLFFSMKLLEGGSLAELLDRYTRDPRGAVRLVVAVARAVDHAHRRGVLHRDLKPSNVLLDAESQPYVADFGLAKWADGRSDLTHTGTLLGTPSYMAPEQTASPSSAGPAETSPTAVTIAADVYGLGAVLYALLTGRPPFRGRSVLETLEQVRHAAVVPPRTLNGRVDRDLETVCLKCLEKEPSQRYRTAEELAEELERWLSGQPVKARRVSGLRHLWRWARRHPALAGLSTAVAALFLVTLVTLAVSVPLVQQERDKAQAQRLRAEASEREGRLQLYAADMALARRAWLQGDLATFNAILAHWQPQPGQEDLRCFAWHYLDSLRRSPVTSAPRAIEVHRGDVYRLALSPDGRTLASAGKDCLVYLRDAASGDLRGVLRGHSGEVNSVEFDRQGQRLATASDDGSARVWDAATGRQLQRLDGHGGEVVAAVFTPDGRALVTAGQDGYLRQWPLAGGQPARAMPAHADRIEGMALSPNGLRVASAGKDGYLRVHELATGRLRWERMVAREATAVAYAPDGRTLAVGAGDGNVRLLRESDGATLSCVQTTSGVRVEDLAFSPDGRTLAVCGLEGRLRLWDVRTGTLQHCLDGDCPRFWCVAFSSDGKKLWAGARDGRVREWDLALSREPRLLAAGGDACSLAFAADAGLLVSAGKDGVVRFWDPADGRELAGSAPLRLAPSGEYVARFEGCGHVFAVLRQDGALERWDADLRRLVSRWGGPGRAVQLGAHAHGKDWYARTAAGQVLRWQAGTGTCIPVDLGGARCTALACSADGTTLATARTGCVHLERPATRQSLELPLADSAWESPCVAFSPDGAAVAVVDVGYVIRLWPTAGGRSPVALRGSGVKINDLAFSPEGKVLASGGERGVTLWHLASGRELFTLPTTPGGVVRELAFSPGGGLLAAAVQTQDNSGGVALWRIQP
jgi:WD40 repeat protein/predicted Ser/Thr protein kinase